MGKEEGLLIGITKALLMKGSYVSVCACSAGVCVSSCVIVISVDPVIKCSGPEGLPDIKALNDAIYYVRCVDVCVSLCPGFFIAFLPHVFVGWGGVGSVLLLGSI